MTPLKKPSLADWSSRLVETVGRFPVTFVYIVLATVHLWFVCGKMSEGDYTCIDFLADLLTLGGIVLSYMLHLFMEGRAGGRRHVVMLSANIVWIAVCSFFACHYPLDGAMTAACIACCVAVAVSLFIVPFRRLGDDRPAIRFAIGFLGRAGLAIAVSGLLFLGLELLVLSFLYLFDAQVSDSHFLYLLVFCFVFLAPTLVVVQTPSAEKNRTPRDWMQHRFMNGVIHFLLLPLLFAYLATLYLYVFKIILEWTLPDGWVSWLVTALMFLTVIVVHLLYPVRFQAEGRRFDRRVLRWLPLVVLPLLVLMTIGIVRRFSDYGVSVLRVYLLAFNVWCYAVCIGLCVTRAKRLWWIGGSFAGVLLLLSVLPYNVYSFTYGQLCRDIRSLAEEKGIRHFPMRDAELRQIWESPEDEQSRLLEDKLVYLYTYYDTTDINRVVDAKTVSMQDFLSGEPSFTTVNDMYYFNIQCSASDSVLEIPKGYAAFRTVRYDYETGFLPCYVKHDTLSVTIPYQYRGRKTADTVRMPVAKLKELNESRIQHPALFYGRHTCLYLTGLTCYEEEKDENGYLSGILFLK